MSRRKGYKKKNLTDMTVKSVYMVYLHIFEYTMVHTCILLMQL